MLYVLPIAEDGTLGDPSELPLTGDYMQVPDEFNANGIAASADGQTLIVAQSTDPDGTGSALYAVDADTGDATLIDVGGEGIENADGLVLAGTTLYVVENRSNDVAVVELAEDLESAEIVDVLTNPDFNVPTTGSLALGALYTVNAQFGDTDDTTFEIVRVDLP